MTNTNFITEHAIGDIVYLVTDTERLPRQVTGYLYDSFKVMYRLQQADSFDYYYEIEVTGNKSTVLTL